MNNESKSSTQNILLKSVTSIEDEENDIVRIISVLLSSWKILVIFVFISTSAATYYAFHATEVFKAETLLVSVQEEKSRVPSAFSQLGGLASMAGISIPSDSNVDQVLATLQSRTFLSAFIKKNNLLPILFEDLWNPINQSWLEEIAENQPSEQRAVRLLKTILSVEEDQETGLIKLSISWKDSNVAAEWVNDLVIKLNEQLRHKAIADSQKQVGYLEQELANTTLQDMRTVLYNLLESANRRLC